MSVDLFRKLYDPSLFRHVSSQLVHLLEEYLRECQLSALKGLNWQDPAKLKARALDLLNQAPGSLADAMDEEAILERVTGLGRQYLETNNRLHSAHYMGHQVAPVIPLAGLFEVLGSVSNQASGVYEMGQFPNAAERALVQKMAPYLGWENLDCDAIVTHGGSAANMTALLAARNVHYPKSWQEGVSAGNAGRRPAIVCSAESHYSLTRAAGIIGIGADQVIKAPIDSLRRLDDSRLERVLDHSRADGLEVFCVVGSSCTTPTGAFDRLEPIAKICRERGIWLHVDAAHGGGLFMSRKHRHLLKGAEHADSVTWDAHKMMFVPALCTFLFYRDKKHSFQAFDQDAPYLFAKESNPTLEFDSAVRTLECTKRPLAMALFALWSTFGTQSFEILVDRTIDTTWLFYELLKDSPDFQPLHQPECNILCFRYLPDKIQGKSAEQISAFQAELRGKIVKAGEFYITGTRIDGVMALRVTIMNPQTTEKELTDLMNAIRKIEMK